MHFKLDMPVEQFLIELPEEPEVPALPEVPELPALPDDEPVDEPEQARTRATAAAPKPIPRTIRVDAMMPPKKMKSIDRIAFGRPQHGFRFRPDWPMPMGHGSP